MPLRTALAYADGLKVKAAKRGLLRRVLELVLEVSTIFTEFIIVSY